MDSTVVKVQTKGQIMLPKAWRGKNTVYQAVKDGEIIILKPVQVASDEEVLASASKLMNKNTELLKRLAK